MEIVAEFLGIDEDKSIWHFFKAHYLHFFPKIRSRTSFTRQSSNLWKYKQAIQQRLAARLGALTDNIHIVDSFPVPVCKLARSNRSRLFKGEAAYGYCAAKDEDYYGFKVHLNVSFRGAISAYVVSPANTDDRETIFELAESMSGLVIGDKGYLSKDLKQEMSKYGIQLETPLRKNMRDSRPKEQVKLLCKVRKRVENAIEQLVERFNICNVWARDCWHFMNRLYRKILSHTVAFFLNRLSEHPLQFNNLISS